MGEEPGPPERPARAPAAARRPERPSERLRRGLLRLPKVVRIAAGFLLVIGGLVGFLPILGFWMVPLGLFILTFDIPWIRPYYRRLRVWIWLAMARLRRTPGWRAARSAWRKWTHR